MARFLVPILLLCLTIQLAFAQYGRSAPRSSSSGGYGSKPTSKPSNTGGYGGSYGGIYDNPSSNVEDIEPLDEDQEELEQPEPVQPMSGPAPVRGGYGTFRAQGAEQNMVQGFNGVRYAPQVSSPAPMRAYGRNSFTTAQPRVEDELNEEVQDGTDELEAPVELSTRRPNAAFGSARSAGLNKPKSRSFSGGYGAGSRSYGPNTQFGVQGDTMQTLGQRQQHAAMYGGSVPQLIAPAQNNLEPVDDEVLGDEPISELPEINDNQYAPARSSDKKRIGSSFGHMLGGSVPSYATQGQRSSGSRAISQGPINAAVQSKHNVEFRDLPSESAPIDPITIEVAPNQNEIQFRFKSASSKLNIENEHESSPGSFSETQSEDEPHMLKHTVTRPIFQEVHEIITPSRKVLQEIQPVQEEIQTIVARSEGKESTDLANGANIGNGLRPAANGAKAKAKSTGAQRSSSSGGYGNGGRSSAASSGGDSFSPSAANFGFSTQAPTNSFAGYGRSQFGGVNSKPASASAKPKKNGGSISNGQPMLTMSFNYGPASTSYSNGARLSSNVPPKAPKTNGKQKNGGLSSQTRSGYGSTFTDDNQSTGAMQVDRVGNGVAYKMMTFTMGTEAMKKAQSGPSSSTRSGYGSTFNVPSPQSRPSSSSRSGYGSSRNAAPIQPGPSSSSRSGYGSSFNSAPTQSGSSSSTRSGYGSSRGSSLGLSSGASSANLFAPTVTSGQTSQRLRTAPSTRPKLNDALIEDELENGEINVDLFEDEPSAASATGGAFIVSAPAKQKSAARSGVPSTGYRGQLGRTRSSYKRAA